MANESEITDETYAVFDKTTIAVSFALGLPGNILIFLAFRTYPTSAAKLLFQILAVFDAISLVLHVSQRPLMWSGDLDLSNRRTTIPLTIYFNIIYYVCIFANLVLVFLGIERVLYVRFPNSHAQYYDPLDRIKLTLLILGILIIAFCLIITIKMSYYGIAWTVVFLTFYAISPSLCLLACILLIASRYIEKYQERKYFERNKPLSGSHSSFVEKSSSHHSGLSASGPLKGSTSSSHVFKGKKKDPYSLYLVEKSASESHLAIKSNSPTNNILTKSKSGNCVNTVVKLKVPPLASYNNAMHKTTVNKDGLLAQEHEEQLRKKRRMNTQLTVMTVVVSVLVIALIVPLTASLGFMAKDDDRRPIDMSARATQYLILSAVMILCLIHGVKFYVYCAISPIFRRHVIAIFRCNQKALREEDAPSSVQ